MRAAITIAALSMFLASSSARRVVHVVIFALFAAAALLTASPAHASHATRAGTNPSSPTR